MFFDPTIQPETKPQTKPAEAKPDPFARGTLIAWLETKPADQRYPYMHNTRCLLCEYFQAQGWSAPFVTNHTVTEVVDFKQVRQDRLPHGFDVIAGDAKDGGLTYGAALARARKYSR